MRKLNVKYHDELSGAVVHLWVEIRVEKDGVVGKDLPDHAKAHAARRAASAIARRLGEMQEDRDETQA